MPTDADYVLHSKVEGFCFDGDGTLYATEEKIFEVHKEMLSERGHAFTEAHYLTIVGQGSLKAAEIVIETFGLKEEPEAYRRERHARLQARLQDVRFMPGAMAALDKFRYGKSGAHFALVSSAQEPHVMAILDALGIRRRFHLIITADTEDLRGRLKPDPEPYRLAAKRLRVKAYRCVAFEDTPHGAISARDAGMIVVGAPHRFSPREELERVAHHVIPEGRTIGDFELTSIQHLLPQ